MEKKRRKRFNYLPWGIALIVTVCGLASLRSFYLFGNSPQSDAILLQRIKRQSGLSSSSNLFISTTSSPSSNITASTEPQGIYPHDYITIEMRRQGEFLVKVFFCQLKIQLFGK